MEKMRMESVDMTAQNIDRIAELFPNCITETVDENGKPKKAVNFNLLRQMLSGEVLEVDEAYEFTWVGKKAAIVEANRPIRKTLRPCQEESVDWDITENLYIEGDNLEVLKLLQESYLGKVKMIYIDPPYNTGNDFVYADNFRISNEEYTDEMGQLDESGNRLFKNTDANGRFHSDWCSMLYSRLLLARNLLSDDGAIFISIDDNELNNMRKICDEIFGADNFRNTILTRRRIKSLNSQFADNGLYSMNVGFEYVLVYSKTRSFLMKALQMQKQVIVDKGRWDVFWSNADRPTMRYDILGFTPSTGQWRNSKEKADIAVANYEKYLAEFADKMTLEEYYKKTGIKDFIRRIPNATGKNGGVQHWVAPSNTSLRTSNWTDIEVSQIGKEIDLPFDNPKSKQLLMELIKLSEFTPTDIILDFFSGSATTAHAVMQLNAEDGGRRRFIMVQLPEETDEKSEARKAGYANICEIGKERIRRAGEKIKSGSPLNTQDFDVGFRVLKLDDTNMNDVYYAAGDYTQGMLTMLESNIKSDRTSLDLLFGCLLEWGLPLSLPYTSEQIEGCTVHDYNNGDLIACFDENIPDSVIKEIAKRQPLRAVFRDSSFNGSPAKINVGEIFKMLAPDTRVKVI
ncbi:MAG: site-specific DNA-methyltransferase [Eubacteriales bacterium]|nr:site-specific DNA-methyltransferase [Eubacteriales bacterium]